MKISDSITKDGIFEEMDRVCGTDIVTFPLRSKISRLNDAKNKYFSLAFEGDGRYNFDDLGQSSPPIAVQNIVLGTNRYKLSDFDLSIFNILRFTALDSEAFERELKPEFIDRLPDTFLETYKTTVTGIPWRYLRIGDFLYIRETPDYNETDGLRAYIDRPSIKLAFAVFTVTQANPGVFTSVAHGLAVGDTVTFDTNDTIPTPLVAGTNYYIKTVPSADTFTIATTADGTALEITANQATGVHVWLKTSQEVGIVEPHHYYLARKACVPFLIDKKLPQLNKVQAQVGSSNKRSPFYGGDELDILSYFSNKDEDIRPIATTKQILHR